MKPFVKRLHEILGMSLLALVSIVGLAYGSSIGLNEYALFAWTILIIVFVITGGLSLFGESL